MIFKDLEQGSDFWFEARKGIPTASRFKMVMTPGGKPSAQAKKLICELIGEKMSRIPPEGVENYTNRAIRWGAACEGEARHFYCFSQNVNVTNGGFCLTDDGRFGASPDALVGEDGILEIKCVQPDTQVEYLIDKEFPAEYLPQCHGHLIVTGRKWCDFLSYCPGLPPLLLRIEPNEYTEKLKAALEAFYTKFEAALRVIQGPLASGEIPG